VFFLCEATVIETMDCAKSGLRIAVKRRFTDGGRFYCLVRGELDALSDSSFTQIFDRSDLCKRPNDIRRRV
jgi:hypothetical protein